MSTEDKNDTPKLSLAEAMAKLAAKSGHLRIFNHLVESIHMSAQGGGTSLNLTEGKVSVGAMVFAVPQACFDALEREGITVTKTQQKIRIGPWWWFKSITINNVKLSW